MPGLIDQIKSHSTSGQGAASLGDLGAVAGKLGNVIHIFQTLPSQPTAAITSLLQEVGNLPVPQLRVATQVGTNLTHLADSMPTDFSSFTTAFEPILENLASTVGGDVVPAIRNFIDLIQAVQALGNFNLEDASQEIPPGGSPGAPAVPGAPGAPASPPVGGGVPAAPGAPAPASPGGSAPPSPPAAPAAPGAPGGGASGPTPATLAKRAERLAALKGVSDGFAMFPSPLSAPALVLFLEDIMSRLPRENAKIRKLPMFDDAQQLLQTTVRLRGMNDAELLEHLRLSLNALAIFLDGTFAGYLQNYGNDLLTAATAAHLAELQSDLALLSQNLGQVATAFEAGNLSGTSPKIAAAADALSRIKPALSALHGEAFQQTARDLTQRTRRLPVEMERQMKQVLAHADPANAFHLLADLTHPMEQFLATNPAAQIAADFHAMLAMPLHLLDLVEASGLQQALEAPTNAINTILNQMDVVTGQIASGTAGVFGSVNQVLDQINPEAWLAQLRQLVTEFKQAVENKVKALFQPIVDAIQTAVTTLKTAADSFDPEAIVASIKKFLDDLAGILENKDVQDALNALHGGMDQASQFIQGLHFSPVTDAVEEGIQKVTDILGMIEPALLPDEVKSTLQSAVAKLPANLDAPIAEITSQFDGIVDAGPKELLAFLSKKAKEVKAELEKFSPSALIGDSMSNPFKDIIAALEGFHPATLLDPVRTALDGFRNDLMNRIDPSPLLSPLQPHFDSLKQKMDSINPEEILKPVQDAVADAAKRIRDALPLDELVAILGVVIDKIDSATQVASEFRKALEKVLELLNALTDSETQLRAWLQPVFVKVGNIADVSSLQPAITAISATVIGSKAAGLTTAFYAARNQMKGPLDALAPADALEQCVNLRRRFRPDKMTSISAGPEKTALSALLADFEPLQPSFSEPLQTLASLRTALTEITTEWTATMSRWDARHHRAGSPLAGLSATTVTAAALRDMLAQTLETEFVKPVGSVFNLVGLATQAIRAPLQEIVTFLQTIETRATALLTGPGTLGGLRTGLQGLADRISGIDIGFLVRDLKDLFDAIKAKVAFLDPSHIASELKGDLETALSILNVDTLVPPALLPSLDGLCSSIAAKLKLLDPKVIVEKTLDPVWNERVKPQIEKLDFSPLLDALLAKLDELKTELGDELGQVNEKYQGLLAAVPSGSGSPSASASVSL